MTITVTPISSNNSFGSLILQKSHKKDYKYFPRWMNRHSDLSNLIDHLGEKVKDFPLRALQDTMVGGFGRADTQTFYWTVSYSAEVTSLTLNDEVIPKAQSINDGISYPKTSWYQKGGTVYIFWPTLRKRFGVILSDYSTQLVYPTQNGRMFFKNGEGDWYFEDPENKLDYDGDYYEMYYTSQVEPTLKINFVEYSPNKVYTKDAWYYKSRTWMIPERFQDGESLTNKGKIQAITHLRDPASQISATLFGTTSFWWEPGVSETPADGDTFDIATLGLGNPSPLSASTLGFFTDNSGQTVVTNPDFSIATLGLGDPDTMLVATLGFLSGGSTAQAASGLYLDTNLQSERFVTEIPTKQSSTVFHLLRTPVGFVEVSYLSEWLEETQYSVSGSVLTLVEPIEFPDKLVVRYRYKILNSKGTTLEANDQGIYGAHPVFGFKQTLINTLSKALDNPRWDSPQYVLHSQASFL